MPVEIAQPTNVVSVVFDDLNAFVILKSLFAGTLITPNLDRMMSMGTTFENTFAQAAICNASRTSALTGLDPSLTGVFHNFDAWYDAVDPSQTLPALLHSNGYFTGLIGKVFHDQPPAMIENLLADVVFRSDAFDRRGITTSGPFSRPEEEHGDYINTSEAIDFIRAAGANPFALFHGIKKPHLSWDAPQEYYDLYPLDSIELPFALDGDLSDVPAFMRDLISDLHGYILDTIGWKAALQGYFASITFADAMLGRLLDELEQSGHLDDTAIVIWTDHGYHLGDKDNWHKFTLWDESGRAPMIVALPGSADDGQRVSEVVELVDLMPTILDLMGVPIPAGGSGQSLVPFIENPSLSLGGHAITTMYGSVSIRTSEYRYTLYEDGSTELYDIVNDPHEWYNLAASPAHATVAADLDRALKADLSQQGWIWTEPGQSTSGSGGVNVFVGHGATHAGGQGDDVYFILNSNQRIVEAANGGDDTVFASVSYVLPDNVENFQQRVNSAPIVIRGNELANHIWGRGLIFGLGGDDVINVTRTSTVDAGNGNDTIIGQGQALQLTGGEGDDFIRAGFGDDRLIGAAGNDEIRGGRGADILDGGGGSDLLYGGRGSDSLTGGFSADVLDGGEGVDVLIGGFGNDTYFVDRAEDVVVEGAGEGTDTVRSTSNYVLSDNVENLTLVGLLAVRGTGNLLANTLIGNGADNFLDGAGGTDTLIGGLGNDTYFADNIGDIVVEREGAGTDTVYATASFILGNNIERLILNGQGSFYGTGNGLANVLTGNAGGNRLDGLGGNDVLTGNAGADVLIGGLGQDRMSAGVDTVRDVFVYTDIAESRIGTQHDVLIDFHSGEDMINLRLIDANTRLTGNQAFTFSASGARAFSVWAFDSGQNILIRGDVNGDRTADFEFLIAGVQQVGASDFLL